MKSFICCIMQKSIYTIGMNVDSFCVDIYFIKCPEFQSLKLMMLQV